MKIPELTPEEAAKRLGERTRWLIHMANEEYNREMVNITKREAAAKSKQDNAIRKLQAECEHTAIVYDENDFCFYCGKQV